MARASTALRLSAAPAAAALALALGGCPSRPPSEAPQRLSQTAAEREVDRRFDLKRHVTNEFIPRAGEPPPAPLASPRRLRVALQWVFTGDAAPWFVAQRKGFFSALGLDVELIEGGPGREMLGGVVMGRYDIYLGYPEVVFSMIASPTGTDMTMVCAGMKDSGVGWMGLDRTIPQGQRSTRHITVGDLRGRRIGVQPGADFLLELLCDQMGLAPSDVTPMNEGATPDTLIAGVLDYYQGLRSDQPRLLERAGYLNWTFLPASQFGYVPYMNVSAVTTALYHAEPKVLACYVYAINEAIAYIAAHRDEAAAITVASIPGDSGTEREMRTRIDREIPLYLGDGSELPLYMGEAKLRRQLALLYRYHRVELPAPAH